MTIMRDVAIAKSEFNPDERAITKIQDFQVGIINYIGLVLQQQY